MSRRVRHVVAIAAAAAAVCVLTPAASAQDSLGDVLGAVGLNDILTQITLPQITVPDPEAGGTAPSQTPQTPTQTPTTTTPSVRAAGYYCKGESKRHVRGFKGTPFGQCVGAMMRLKATNGLSPRKACSSVTKRHFPGMKKTPYALCVSGGRALVADQK